VPTRRDILLSLGSLAFTQAMPGCAARSPLSIGSHVWPGYEPTAAFRMAIRLGVTGQQVPDAFRGLTLPDIDANRTLPGTTGSVRLADERLNRFMSERGLLERPDSLDRPVSAEYLPRRMSVP
jgi:hypothetical protein